MSAEIEALLRSGAAAPEDALARAFVRVDPRDAAAVGEALARSERLTPSPERERLAGRALLELGRAAEAAGRLAAAGDAARGELAAALLLSGRADEALAAASAAGAAVLRAEALLARGDARGAADAARGAEGAAARVVAALAGDALGDARALEAGLSEAARLRPGAAWPRALLAAARAARGDFAGARPALEEARALEPGRAWLHAESARNEEKLGVIPAALAHAARALELEPSLEHRLLRAELLDRWREHASAAEEYGRAEALAPRDAAVAWARAKALSAAGLLGAASDAGRRASALAPDSLDIAAWSARVALAAGRGALSRRLEADLRRRFRSSPGSAAAFDFNDGYRAMRARRWKAAAAAFGRAARRDEGSPAARRAAFYAAAARALAASGPARPRGLALAGLGVHPPYSATIGDLRVLAACRVLFNNVMGDEMFEFLRALCPDVRSVAYHQDNDEPALAATILAGVPRRGAAAFVTRGNAIVYGPLGALMLARRRAAGASWSCRPGVSSLEFLHARHGAGPLPPGLAALDSRALARGAGVDPRLATAVFWDMTDGAAEQDAACRALAASAGPAAACLIFDHVVAQEPLRRRADEVLAARPSFSPSALILLLPRGGA